MSKVERKEYKETRVIRSKSPVRMRGSSQNVAAFDNNLDNLLEDLQNSVSRPDSALGSNAVTTYRETRHISGTDGGRSNSLNRITNLSAANPTTEYASGDAYSYTSPDGTKSVKTVKKEVYAYKTTGGEPIPEKTRMQNNINQLDSLLDDLQQVKQASGTYNRTGGDPGFQEYSKSKIITGKTVVERDIIYPDTPKSSRSRTLDRSDREGSVNRELQYSSEGSHGEVRTLLRTASPSPSRVGTLSKQTKVTNVHSYPMEVTQTTTPDINPEILASLDPNLLPSGNTKVTTTIKTYTYEIPGTVYPSPNSTVESEQYVYSPNQTQTTPSKSFVYNKFENDSLTRNVNYQTDPNWQTNVYKETTTNVIDQPPYKKPPPPAGGKTVVTETIRNYQPGTVTYPDGPGGKETYVYNETTVTKNINENYPGYPNQGVPLGDINYPPLQDYQRPPNKETYLIKETHTTNTNTGSPPYLPDAYPPLQDYQRPPNKETYLIKETHTTNTNTGSPPYLPDAYPPVHRNEPGGQTTVIYKHDTRNTNTYTTNKPRNDVDAFGPKHPPYGSDPGPYPPVSGKPSYDGGYQTGNGKPNQPVNITYKYTSTSSSTNNYKGGYPPGDESEPLLQPRPFPLDDGEGPPKKLEELMANIGNEPPNSPLNAGYNAHEIELAQQKKVDTLKRQNQELEQRKEPKEVQRSKNVTGPPVYYPPGHEMFAKKEESGGWRAEGAMSKESGRYKYEAESKSKTKTKSGAAIVPVCLPLCCGLPCTIL